MESKLKQLGTEWNKAGAKRFYFNDLETAYGLKFNSDISTGCIVSVTLDGAEICKAKGALLRAKLALGTVWFDTVKGSFHFKGLDDVMANQVIDYLRNEIVGDHSDSVLNGYIPDYQNRCDNCDQTPVVTHYTKGVKDLETDMCGPCTWGESETLDPDTWNGVG